jgi:hypothetical protein
MHQHHLDALLADLQARAGRLRQALSLPPTPACRQVREGIGGELLAAMRAVAQAVEGDRTAEVAALLSNALRMRARLTRQRQRQAEQHAAHRAGLLAARRWRAEHDVP